MYCIAGPARFNSKAQYSFRYTPAAGRIAGASRIGGNSRVRDLHEQVGSRRGAEWDTGIGPRVLDIVYMCRVLWPHNLMYIIFICVYGPWGKASTRYKILDSATPMSYFPPTLSSQDSEYKWAPQLGRPLK